jgi:hypothetical protein
MIFIKRFLQQLCAIFGTRPTHTSTHNISKTQLKISCGFYRIIDLGLLHFYFSSKNYSSKTHTPLEKVIVSVTLGITKLGFLFLYFSTIFNRFYKLQPFHPKRIESLCKQVPGKLKLFTTIPSIPHPCTRRRRRACRRRGEARGGKQARGISN